MNRWHEGSRYDVYIGRGPGGTVPRYGRGKWGTPEDPHTFDLVTFSSYEPREVLRAGEWRKEIGEPSWSALDRASVEALIGKEV